MMRWSILLVLASCSFSSKLVTPGGGMRSSGASSSESASALVAPDVRGMTPEQALAAVRKAGFTSDQLDVHDQLCNYSDGELMVAQGTVCNQSPMPGKTYPERASFRVTIEHDTPTHGEVTYNTEWRLMPDLIGKTYAEAKAILAKNGFDVAKHFEHVEGSVDCPKDIVCKTSPPAGSRVVLRRGGRLFVGIETPAAATPPAQPTPPTSPRNPPPADDSKKDYF
jgi:beta-lactam-binding protein with PASTA domain